MRTPSIILTEVVDPFGDILRLQSTWTDPEGCSSLLGWHDDAGRLLSPHWPDDGQEGWDDPAFDWLDDYARLTAP